MQELHAQVLYIKLRYSRLILMGRGMVGKGIVIDDMHIRDERVLEWLKRRLSDQRRRVTCAEISDKFGCHRNTALKIMHRLEGAGHIKADRRAKRGGYRYELVS